MVVVIKRPSNHRSFQLIIVYIDSYIMGQFIDWVFINETININNNIDD